MFKNFKKMLIWIPCMVLGLFLISGINVAAKDTVLTNGKKITVGENASSENTYYFTNNRGWEFDTSYNIAVDTYLTYRVIKPDGSATAESKKINYVNSGGVFSIGDYTGLSYSEKVDVSKRNSIAPAGTYYVDIKYYGSYLEGLITWDQNKDETLKIVVCEDTTESVPSVSISYDKVANKYTVNASVLKNGEGYSIINSIEYYFSDVAIDNEISTFRTHKEESSVSGEVENFERNSNTTAEIEGTSNSSLGYLYVMVTTANNYSKIVHYEIVEDEDVQGNGGQQAGGTGNNSGDTGLFDFEFGQLILLVLVVVLIVSCVLIITQKIVDHKKRLY